MGMPGAVPPTPRELTRVGDRITFLYVEHATLSRKDSAVTVTNDRGVVHVPAAQLTCLLIGPGCRVTHHAVMLLADCGTSVVWVGEKGVRFYAAGRGLSRSARMIEAQARLVLNERSRLRVARAMYAMRFPGEDVSRLSMQQLRGREGARVRRLYREHSERTGVAWARRDYSPDDFDSSDDVNKALSAANSALYGVVHSVIVALGCSPELGFVHTGGDLAFVHDVADLYKAETSIPVAFDTAAAGVTDVAAYARRAMRDAMVEHRVLESCVRDLRRLVLGASGDGPLTEGGLGGMDGEDGWSEILALWDGADRLVAAGVNYAGEDDTGGGTADW